MDDGVLINQTLQMTPFARKRCHAAPSTPSGAVTDRQGKQADGTLPPPPVAVHVLVSGVFNLVTWCRGVSIRP